MRQSIGGAWLFSISITLMMFIIAYVSISMDYSNAYQLKNDMVLVLEEYNGLNKKSAALIIQKMKKRKFSTKLDCSKYYDSSTFYDGDHDGKKSKYYFGIEDYNSSTGTITRRLGNSSQKVYAFACIYKYTVPKSDSTGGTMYKTYYAVSTAFGFNFPIIGQIFDYRVTGETGEINYPNDESPYIFDD